MIDLSFNWPGSAKSYSILKYAANRGWSSLGFNVYFRADGHGVHQIDCKSNISQLIANYTPKLMPPSLNNPIPTFKSTLSDETSSSSGNGFVRRITVILMDDFKPNSLLKFIDSNEFDIFSVIPTSKRSFQVACESINCDLINLNHYCYFSSFKLKRGLINSSIQRGCFFEVSLSDKLLNFDNKDSNESISRSFQKNLPSLLKYIPLKRLVLSTGSRDISEITDPKLLIGSCNELFSGFSGKKVDLKCCLNKVPRDCIIKGSARRTYGTGIIAQRKEKEQTRVFI